VILLTADWHLTDQPQDEYRWRAFDHVRAARKSNGVTETIIAGDLVDRKDRFSAAFVNRLLAALETIAPVIVLRGNHDTALREPNYFDWMADMLRADVHYITEPWTTGRMLLLPFTPTPTEDWEKLQFADFRAAVMHATVTGARVSNGIVLENPGFPKLPPHLKVYSGDIHHPQHVNGVTYIGAPHAVKFGDDYKTRMLVIHPETYDMVLEIPIETPRKLIAEIRSIRELPLNVRRGDQVRIRINGNIEDLTGNEAAIALWAQEQGVTLAGIDVIVETTHAGRGVDTTQTPEAILREFAVHEQIGDDVLDVGLALLKEATDART
jgi:DNA repair exonuclease SbcCD nuclease subunit